MKLTMNIKPSKKEGKTKQGALPKIRYIYGTTYTKYGHGVMADANYVYAFNLEKHRKKSQRIGARGQKLKKPKITPSKWVCYYYQIPVALLEAMGLMVVQGTRTFKITSSKVK